MPKKRPTAMEKPVANRMAPGVTAVSKFSAKPLTAREPTKPKPMPIKPPIKLITTDSMRN